MPWYDDAALCTCGHFWMDHDRQSGSSTPECFDCECFAFEEDDDPYA